METLAMPHSATLRRWRRADALNKRDCQSVERAENRIALTRDRGAGNRGEFVVQ